MISATGNWNPAVFLLSILIVGIIVWIIRRSGEKDCREEGCKTLPFFSGDLVAGGGIGNFYWGFLEAMEGYYRTMSRLHSGMINDYVYWFVLTVVVTTIIMMGV